MKPYLILSTASGTGISRLAQDRLRGALLRIGLPTDPPAIVDAAMPLSQGFPSKPAAVKSYSEIPLIACKRMSQTLGKQLGDSTISFVQVPDAPGGLTLKAEDGNRKSDAHSEAELWERALAWLLRVW